MSTDKTPKRRKAGGLVHRKPAPRLRLVKPPSECSTTGLVIDFPVEVRELLRGQKRRREGPADDNPRDAA